MNDQGDKRTTFHEPSDANTWLVLAIGGMTVVAVAIGLGLAAWTFDGLSAMLSQGKRPAFASAPRSTLPPPPRLEGIDPPQSLSEVPEKSPPIHWVDREASLVAVPIERAMDDVTRQLRREQQFTIAMPPRPVQSRSGREESP